jgi:hypothetical protein
MNDPQLVSIVVIVSTAIVLYLAWRNRHDREQWNRERQDQNLVLELHRELESHKATLLARCSELDHKLNEHRRILNYLARRLS